MKMNYKLTGAQRDELKRVVKKVMKMRSKGDRRPSFESVEIRHAHWGDNKGECLLVTATDGHRLAVGEVMHNETFELRDDFCVVVDCEAAFDKDNRGTRLTEGDREMFEKRGEPIPDDRTDVEKLLDAEDIYLSLNENQILADGEVIHSSGDYPDWRQVVPNSSAQTIVGDKRELAKLTREIEKRARAVNKERKARRKEKIDVWEAEIEALPLSAASEKRLKALRCNIANEPYPVREMSELCFELFDDAVSGHRPVVSSVEVIPHIEAASGPGAERSLRTFDSPRGGTMKSLKVKLNATYVKQALSAMHGNNLMVEFNEPHEPVVFTDGKMKVVVMVMRL